MMRPDGNETRRLDPELHVLDAVLRSALRIDTPADLVQRIYDQTVGHLPFLTPDADLHEIETVLRRELATDVPADLSRKVYDATVTALPHYLDEDLAAIDSELATTMQAPSVAPAGLSDRIIAATAGRLDDHNRETLGAVSAAEAMGEPMPQVAGRQDAVVLARIGFTTWVRRMSMAAAIIMGVSAGWWLYQYAELPDGVPVENRMSTVIALENELDRFADSLAGSPTQLDTQIMNLAADIEQVEAVAQSPSYTDPLIGGSDQIADELSLLEMELGSF